MASQVDVEAASATARARYEKKWEREFYAYVRNTFELVQVLALTLQKILRTHSIAVRRLSRKVHRP